VLIRLLAISFLTTLAAADYSFFIPPKDWELANPEKLSPRVKMGFIGSTKKELRPSVNLAMEEVDVSMNDYVAAVKKIHESDPNNRWRDLGKFSTPAGEARLTEIEAKSEWGDVRLLQLIILKNKTAYIITASALKEEFSRFYQEFQSVFRSFTITSDLIGAVPNSEKRQKFQNKCSALTKPFIEKAKAAGSLEQAFADEKFQKDHWLPFQNSVIHDYADMGAYWQVLILQSTHEKLMKEQI
jgi:hypothetical protein